jgi:hypothetical protein
MLYVDARFGEAFGYRSLAHTWPLAALVLYRWPRRGDPARFPLAAGALILVLVSLLAPVPGGFQWGARLLLPAAPLLAVAGLLAVTRAAWAGRSVVVAGIVAVALAVQGVGVAFLGHSKRLYAGISRATEAATSAGDVIASDLFWFSQVTPKLHASRRFVLVQSAAELEAVASRAAALGLAGVVFVTSDDESRFAAPHRLADAWSAETSTPLPGRGLRLTAYRPAEPPS